LQPTRKNILYISYDGMTDQLGQSQVIPYLIELSKKGSFNFILLSCEKRKYFEKNRKIVDELLKDYPITWYPKLYHKSPPILSTIFDTWNIYKSAKNLNKKYNFILVHCRSYISSLIGLKLKKKFGIPFLFDMRGFWANERVDANLWNLKNPLYKFIYTFFKKKERDFLNDSASIVSLTELGKKEILTWKGITFKPGKINIIPCCVDLQHFSETTIDKNYTNTFKKDWNITQDDFVLTYLGATGTWYMLPEMLRFFILLKAQEKNAKFLFISPEESHESIRSEARKLGIQNDWIILIHATRKQVPSLLSLSNYGIYFIKPTYSKISSSPTKQAELMAMGIPAITNKSIGDTEQILRESNAGILIENFTDKAYHTIIEKITNKNFHFDSSKIRAGAINHYSLTSGVESYFNIYNSII
jgi:glycosyltransferase involved in cell wall biosynthesis